MAADTYSLIGRQREQAELQRALAAVQQGQGGLVLLAGEAGVGKTRLAEDFLTQSGCLILKGGASETATPPYGPITMILRTYLRLRPGDLTRCGPLAKYLALLLPELGAAPDQSDRATLGEALRCAFETMARHEPTAIFLDDLQWADNATLELLPSLTVALSQIHLLLVGAYRSDEIPRSHPLRRLRHELRRLRQLSEIVVEPLNQAGTGLLAARTLNQALNPTLVAILYDRTQGVPLFVEELASALVSSGGLRSSQVGLELIPGETVPVPDTVRDAVLLRLDRLSQPARRRLEIAAVAGLDFDLELIVKLAGDEAGLEELFEYGLIREVAPGRGAFRHALTREAIYGDILWTRRRSLHRHMASQLEANGAPVEVVAEHWLAARELEQARRTLLLSAEKWYSLHAYRDAAQAAQRALEIWPEGENETQRLAVLDQLGRCAQLCGMFADAARAWREVAEGWHQINDMHRFAETQRRLATVYELQAAWGQALGARQAAAEAFATNELPGEAASERLTIAAHLHGAGSYSAALELIAIASPEAELAGRLDLMARALGLRGAVLAKLGQVQTGRETAQAGLSLALQHNLTAPAAEIYQRLASTLEQAADYSTAREVYLTAMNYCDEHGASVMGQFCMACIAGVLWQTGEWPQAITLCREVMASATNPPIVQAVAAAHLGLVYACRGEAGRARKLLFEATTQAQRNEVAALELICEWCLAMVAEQERAYTSTAEHCRLVLERWAQTEERHYVIPTLRWAATFFAGQGAKTDTRACAEALSKIATATGNPEALAALAHALGEAALLDQEAGQAARQFDQALALLRTLEVPFQRAETELRAGVALAAAGEREAGVQYLVKAHHTARKLGTRPLAAQATQALAALGEKVDRRLGQRAAHRLQQGGLTRRQLEVLRQIALGHTNQEIARDLFLSPRTVDMHVADILARLDCRTRAEAVRKAGELGLLA